MASAAVRLEADVPFARTVAPVPPMEVELALDIALPGRLRLAAVAGLDAVAAGTLLA